MELHGYQYWICQDGNSSIEIKLGESLIKTNYLFSELYHWSENHLFHVCLKTLNFVDSVEFGCSVELEEI